MDTKVSVSSKSDIEVHSENLDGATDGIYCIGPLCLLHQILYFLLLLALGFALCLLCSLPFKIL